MGKKIMLIATLVGVLSLGACVDDKESPSVEKIRNAKAEQLLSFAELNKAEAQAAKTLADAEAGLKQAEAELLKVRQETEKANAEYVRAQAEREKAQAQYLLAQSEYQKAQAAYYLAKADEKLAKAESDKLDLDKKKATLALELEAEAARLEAALWIAKTSLFKEEQTYLSTLNGVNATKRDEVKRLLGLYTTAATTLIDAQKILADYNLDLVELENDLVDLQTAKARTIIGLEKQIAYKEAEKANLEKYATADKAEVQKAVDAVSLEIDVLISSQIASRAALAQPEADLAVIAKWFHEDNRNESEYYNKFATVLNNAPGIYPKDGDYVYDVTNTYGVTTQVTLYTRKETKEILVPYTFEEGGKVQNHIIDEITEFYTVQKTEFDAYIKAYEEYVAGLEKEGSEFFVADAAYQDALEKEAKTQNKVDELKPKKEKADKALEDANKALEDANKAKNEADKAYEKADDAVTEAEDALKALQDDPEATEEDIADAEDILTDAQSARREANAEKKDALAAQKDAVTAQGEADKAQEEAEEEAKEANNNYNDAFQTNQTAHETTVEKKALLDIAKEGLDDKKETLAKVKEAYAYVTDKKQVDLVAAKIKSYNELAKKVADLQIDVLKADKARDLKEHERDVLSDILSRSTDFAEEIARIDTEIEALQDQIETSIDIETKDEAIKNKKVAIEKQKLEVDKFKIERDIAKANFEEAAAGAAADTATGEE
jgi:chromosome segregation ATPase